MDRIIGIHAVEAALASGRLVDRLIVARGAGNPRLQAIIDGCRAKKIPVRFEARSQLDRLTNRGVHQGVVAYAAAKEHASLEDVLANALPEALLVLVDGVEDPHNLGAILRSAEAAGATAVLVPRRRAAPLTETVGKASAGAMERLPVVRTANLNRAIDDLKKAGFWVHGLDERGDLEIWEADFSGRTALVLGAEGAGLHRLTAEKCDSLLRIPMQGAAASLNVSVAAGVALFEVVRQRRNSGQGGMEQ